LPSVDAEHPGRQIVTLVGELEAMVASAESALVERDWDALGVVLADQRRITHAISNAVLRSNGERPEGFDRELNRRLKAIETKRADQMRRLEAFHAAVGQRLTVLARGKAMRRSIEPAPNRPVLINTIQ
jgi:hypothetical protein